MSKRYSVKCLECGKPDTFVDAHAIKQSKWTILAWEVQTGDPMCVCEKCDYSPTGEKKKKK